MHRPGPSPGQGRAVLPPPKNPLSSQPGEGLEAGGLQRGRAIGKMNEVGPVTANAMAELTHGDFLSKAPVGVLTHSQARR